MKIKITEAERVELENILTLISSEVPESYKLGINLLKKYKKFKNTILLFDYDIKQSSGPNLCRIQIKRTVNCNKNTHRVITFIYDLDIIDIDNRNGNLDYDLDCFKFYIKSVLDGDNSFYKG